MAALTCGERTTLRALTPNDLPVLEAWDTDPEIEELMGRKFAPAMPVDAWFRRVLRDPRCKAMAIETADGRLIGELEFEQINWRRGSAELRICIGEKAYWSQGLGTDALRSALRLAFCHWGLRTVYLRVFAHNLRAIRSYEKCGFRREGYLAPSERRGDPDGVILMSLTRERFARRCRSGEKESSPCPWSPC